ncbi:P-loop containing nucleoside triphosphate hydrolase protein [Xylariaceae sp. FL0255]|nr:P-loop containing nucleoside triphosphate hydrolase protein [Xylariaceae sp. FL0255]
MPPDQEFSDGDFADYGPRIGLRRDRHIQQIIDHAQNQFDSPQFPNFQPLSQCSHFSNLAGAPTDEARPASSSEDRIISGNYTGLDGLGPYPSGYSQPQYYDSVPSYNLHTTTGSARVSLPLLPSNNRPAPRIIGDANQYFQPFMPRDPNHGSPFRQRDTSYLDSQLSTPRGRTVASPAQPNPLYSWAPSNPFQHLQLQGNPIWGDQFSSMPQNDPLFSQSSRWVDAAQSDRSLFTPPFSSGMKATPSIHSSAAGSSPLVVDHSSPLGRVTQAYQNPAVAQRSLVPARKFQLSLEHAPDLPPVVNNIQLINPRNALPDKFRAVFPYPLFNAIQSKCFHIVYNTDDNAVVSAPTGSGKTAILEMAICKLVANGGADNFKIVYQAPTKSLCSERVKDWSKKFSHMGLQCVELTGDTSPSEAQRVGSATIIVTTPEKWDSVTRKWKDHRKLLELVRLVLIDEVHILADSRGATLEAVVSRMKIIGAHIRFVALSATVPNVQDVAQWLGLNHETQTKPANFEIFGEELRPVKLEKHVHGYEGVQNDFAFEQMLDQKLTLLISQYSAKKPIIVFCTTRKSCERTALQLAEYFTNCHDKPWPAPTGPVPVSSMGLQQIVGCGVAFHHAGLDAQDRAAIESNYLKGQLHVICCTSTLAVGVNLPCHTVVIKGTFGYTDNGFQEHSDLEIMQMLGRAGRPQFDKSAVAIIMTRVSNVQKYEKLISGGELLESKLHLNLLEHINSEIGLGTIQDLQAAKKWINSTFLNVRIRQSPSVYKQQTQEFGRAANADEMMAEWCERDVQLLQDNGLVTKNTPFVCTDYGYAMSRYMIPFETMKMLISIPRAAEVEEMLRVVCQTPAFVDIKFKANERTVFREYNKSSLVPYPIQETITSTWHKVFIIAQIFTSGVELPVEKVSRLELLRESRVVFDRLNRLIRCVIDCKTSDSDGLGVSNAMELARSIAARAWEDTSAQLSQIPGFGPVAVRKWARQGINSVMSIADMSALEIERRGSRNPPWGQNVLKSLENFPRLTLRADIIESKAPNFNSDEPVMVTLKVRLGHDNAKVPRWNQRSPGVTFLTFTDDGHLSFFWRGNIQKIDSATGLNLRFPVALTGPNQTITSQFSCEDIVGTLVSTTVQPNIPDSVFKNVRGREVLPKPSRTHATIEENYVDIPDDEMLEAEASTQNPQQQDKLEAQESFHHRDLDDDDSFPLIDDVLNSKPMTVTSTPGPSKANTSTSGPLMEFLTPKKMKNGRWMCTHICRDGGRTRAGKPCNHRCCKEGVARPRRGVPKPQDHPTEDSQTNPPSPLTGTPNAHLPQPFPRSNRYGLSNEDNAASVTQTPPTSKRSYSELEFEPQDHITLKKCRSKRLAAPIHASNNVEHVDLSNIDDNKDASFPLVHPASVSRPQKPKPKLVYLEETRRDRADAPDVDRESQSGLSTANYTRHMRYHQETSKQALKDLIEPDVMLSDLYDMSDASDIEETIHSQGQNEEPKATEHDFSQRADFHDETLHLGTIKALEQSLEQGLEPNLSFTTVDELQKASHRLQLNLHSTTKSAPSTPLKSSGPHAGLREVGNSDANSASTAYTGEGVATNVSADVTVPGSNNTDGVGHHTGNREGKLAWDAEAEADADEADDKNEPAWLSALNSGLLDDFQSVANLID